MILPFVAYGMSPCWIVEGECVLLAAPRGLPTSSGQVPPAARCLGRDSYIVRMQWLLYRRHSRVIVLK